MLEAGIVGLPSAGKTTLFNALTKAGVGPDFGKEHVGMAPIADERLDQLAQVVSAAKVTPPRCESWIPGTGPQLLGNLRRVDALLAVVDGYSAGADPDGDLERLELELLVADRDHIERRLERVTKQASRAIRSCATRWPSSSACWRTSTRVTRRASGRARCRRSSSR